MKVIIFDIYGCLIQVTDLDQAIEQVNGYVVSLKKEATVLHDQVDLDCIAYWDDIHLKLIQIASL